jgi:predicted amidophosphoribosyltransferase
MVADLKFAGSLGVVCWAAEVLAGALVAGPRLQVVTWVPTTPAHRRRRGRDQAEVLARGVARAAGLPLASLLRRGPGLPQRGRSAVERAAGPPLRANRPVPAGVVVVDDVVTTGGSVAAAARALRSAGASTVVAAALARTPVTTTRRGDDAA